jgi:hypothetical protein
MELCKVLKNCIMVNIGSLTVGTKLLILSYTRFLCLLSVGEYQSEECHATRLEMWDRLTVFMCFYARFAEVMQYTARLTMDKA